MSKISVMDFQKKKYKTRTGRIPEVRGCSACNCASLENVTSCFHSQEAKVWHSGSRIRHEQGGVQPDKWQWFQRCQDTSRCFQLVSDEGIEYSETEIGLQPLQRWRVHLEKRRRHANVKGLASCTTRLRGLVLLWRNMSLQAWTLL